MKLKLTVLLLVLAVARPGQAAQPATTEESLITLESLQNPVSQASSGVNDIRMQMLTDAGRTLGFRGGQLARAKQLTTALQSRADHLDTIYQFSTVINKNGTIPPVIVEASDVASIGPTQIRTADRVYKIEKPERFVSVPPTWRDYLLVGLSTSSRVELPPPEARPKNSGEEKVWRTAVQRGWTEGTMAADDILSANFNRLTRDFTGMLLYSRLLQHGMVTTTKVAESVQTVTGNTKQLTLGDRHRRLTAEANFETNAAKWQATVSKQKQAAPAREPQTTEQGRLEPFLRKSELSGE